LHYTVVQHTVAVRHHPPSLALQVFRTYNASVTLDRLLADVSEEETVEAKAAEYNRANKEVHPRHALCLCIAFHCLCCAALPCAVLCCVAVLRRIAKQRQQGAWAGSSQASGVEHCRATCLSAAVPAVSSSQ
jgi:hypothetical protein